MSKIICEICGTTYPDTADSCPICGCSREAASDFLGEDIILEEIIEDDNDKPGKFTSKKKKEIFDFDEVNAKEVDDLLDDENPYTEDDDEDENNGYEEKRGHNVFVIILLTVLIVALLAAAGFIFIRYFLPNMKDAEKEPVVTEAVAETAVPTTTELSIPCQMLILTSGTAELSQEGQMFLLHVQPTPEDTTDEILYLSGDENVATVNADGKVTAVGEGETVIYISCGNIQTTCPVVVKYVEETVPVETEAAVPAETEAAETIPEETKSNGALKNVTLKLKQTDIRLGVYYEYQLKLDCELEQNEVEWRSEHPHIATVDENGVIKAVKDGTTAIIAKYGDQEVSCMVRCSY